MKVDRDLAAIERDGLTMGDDPRTIRIDQGADLAQRPAQRTARIVWAVTPEQIDQMLSALRPCRENEVGEQRARLARGGSGTASLD
ncbi:hypothetical protein QP150_00905 [Sphingomonas sp. 22L2VL55-3]